MAKATDVNPVLFQALAFLAGRAYEDAKAHGLYDHPALDRATRSADAVRQRLTLLIREEVCEMWEAYDNPAHFAEELADVVIMCFSAAGHLGIDLALKCGERWRSTKSGRMGTAKRNFFVTFEGGTAWETAKRSTCAGCAS